MNPDFIIFSVSFFLWIYLALELARAEMAFDSKLNRQKEFIQSKRWARAFQRGTNMWRDIKQTISLRLAGSWLKLIYQKYFMRYQQFTNYIYATQLFPGIFLTNFNKLDIHSYVIRSAYRRRYGNGECLESWIFSTNKS